MLTLLTSYKRSSKGSYNQNTNSSPKKERRTPKCRPRLNSNSYYSNVTFHYTSNGGEGNNEGTLVMRMFILGAIAGNLYSFLKSCPRILNIEYQLDHHSLIKFSVFRGLHFCYGLSKIIKHFKVGKFLDYFI